MTRIRVLVAEDSDAMRAALLSMLGLDPRLEVIGTARDGAEAVEAAKSLRPDVITMDVMMPRLDGVQATAQIMAECPARILIVSAYADDSQVDLSFRAIAAGALEVISKPASGGLLDLRGWAKRVCDTIVLMSEVPVIKRSRRAPTHTQRIDVIGIAASTGGPLALAQLFSQLPANLAVPILVAQHIAEGFTLGMVRWLSKSCPLPVDIASDGTVARTGHIYFPPDGSDLELSPQFVMRTPRAAERHTPSGDRLLGSLARNYAARAAGIVLTGMGDDGARGLLAIRDAGGATLAQSEESCVVYGMPQAARARGATSDMRSIEGIGLAIVELARR